MQPEPAQAMNLEEYLGAWLAHSKARVRGKTWDGYECIVRRRIVPHLGKVPLGELSPLQIQGLYDQLLTARPPLSGGTILNAHLLLSHALSQAVRWGYLAANPAMGAQPPRPKRKELAVVDHPFAERILQAAADTRYELPVAIAIATGMRRGEILALRWEDIDKDYSVARVRRTLLATNAGLVFEPPKTRRSRRAVVLPQFLRPYLKRERASQATRRRGRGWEENDLVCCRKDGSAINPDTLTSGWAPFLKRRGIPHIRFHDLRHAHATLMLSKGVHPKIVSERLGHASIGITLDTYSHVLPSMQAEAAEAFDELFTRAPS